MSDFAVKPPAAARLAAKGLTTRRGRARRPPRHQRTGEIASRSFVQLEREEETTQVFPNAGAPAWERVARPGESSLFVQERLLAHTRAQWEEAPSTRKIR